MDEVIYVAASCKVADEQGRLHERWGVAAFRGKEQAARFADLSGDEARVRRFTASLNEHKLPLLHFYDAVCDFAAAE